MRRKFVFRFIIILEIIVIIVIIEINEFFDKSKKDYGKNNINITLYKIYYIYIFLYIIYLINDKQILFKYTMYIGYISTNEKIIIKKNYYKLIILTEDLDKSHNYYISYKGKLKGKIIITFKILDNSNINHIICNTIDVIGLLTNENLITTLKYIYDINRKNISSLYENDNEKNINRILIDKNIFSIDPDNSKDIDDAISFEQNIVSIYIAQPICWLNEEILLNRCNTAFSTLYNNNDNNNLWGDDITFMSSFIQNTIRNAHCIEFNLDNGKIINYPCKIINRIQTTYNKCLDYDIIKDFYNMTKKLYNIEIDTHELISYWMIKVNNYFGKLNNVKILDIPYRIIKEKYNEDNVLNNYNNIKNENIKNVFLSKITNTAIYAYDNDINYHKLLNVHNYIHFTSPIRRIIDTLIHWCITYNINFKQLLEKYNITLDKINFLNKMTTKYHKNIELLNYINNVFIDISEFKLNGYIFNKSINNIWTIYFNDLGFRKVKIWDNKFSYLLTEDIINNINNINIGDMFIFTIYYKLDFLPKNKILIVPYNLVLI